MESKKKKRVSKSKFYSERVQSAVFAAAQADAGLSPVPQEQVAENSLPQLLEQLSQAGNPVEEGRAWIQIVQRWKYEQELFLKYLASQIPVRDEALLGASLEFHLENMAVLVPKILDSPFRPKFKYGEIYYNDDINLILSPAGFSSPRSAIRAWAYGFAAGNPKHARECEKEIAAAAAKETEKLLKQAAEKALAVARAPE